MWPKAIIQRKFPNFILKNLEKQIAPCEHNTREVSFEWSHDWIWSTDVRVRATLQNLIINSGSKRIDESYQPLPSSHSCSGTLCPVFNVCVFFLSFSLSSVSLFRKICYPIAVTWRRIGAQRGRKKLRFRN